MNTKANSTPGSDRESHEKMGFHQGWGIATDQLTALAKTL